MQALVVEPGRAHSARVEEVPAPRREPKTVLLRPLEVGVCGTDREIAEGLFGIPPEGSERLVLGHEVLARVEEDAEGFARGDLVAATVRRSCGRCAACAQGAPDACETGLYVERGITRLDGFAAELVAEHADQLVPVPPSLGRLGVLTEPASICERALRHLRAIGGRQPWSPQRALVLGAGAIGMLTTTFLRLAEFEVWTASQEPACSLKAQLASATGARYVPLAETSAATLAEDVGGFDVVVEAAGNAQLMADALGLLRRNGVACLLGIDGRPQQVTIDGTVLAEDFVVQNRVLFGSVNAHRVDWQSAVEELDLARARWPETLEAFVGLRVPLARFDDAFAFSGVKATLLLD